MTARRPSAPKNRPRSRLVTACLTLLLLSLSVALFNGQAHWLAWYWDRQLDAVESPLAARQLDRLAALGDPALDYLVLRLGDPRPAVAQAAHARLLATLDASRGQSHPAALERFTTLAAALERRSVDLPPTGQQHAADLAFRMMIDARERGLPSSPAWVASCESVVRAAAPSRDQLASTANATVARPLATDTSGRAMHSVAPVEPDPALTALPGGGIPVTPVEPADATLAERESPDGDPQQHAPGTDDRLDEPRRLPPGTPQVTPVPSVASNEPMLPASPPTEGPHRETPRAEANEPETIQLVRLLHSSDAEKASRAARELRKQGFSERHLEVGRRLADPDPNVRREWAELLPRIRGIDARPWLLWLTHDPDAEVRLLALTLLATSNDPELAERMRELLQTDSDPRIRAQAERYLGHDPRRRR